MEPLCGYDIDYTVEEVTAANSLQDLPSFINYDNDDEIEIVTNDDNDAGEYIIQITGELTEGP